MPGEKTKRVLLIAVVSLFLLSIAPIVAVGLHARPSWDDFTFSAASSFSIPAGDSREYYIDRGVRQAALGGGVINVISAVARTVSDNYVNWQGTFSAIALFSAHPGVIFGPGAYPLTMLFTLFSLIGATFFLCKKIFGENSLLLCVIVLTCSIQWIPHIAQGFFWFNGAVYYTFFYSLMVFSLALKTGMLKSGEFSLRCVIAAAVLDFFIGGGNYVSALLSVEINALIMLYAIYKYRPGLREKKDKWVPFAVFFLASLAGLLVSAAAPGNAVRGGMFESAFSIGYLVKVIYTSIAQSVVDIFNWTKPGIALLLIMACPVMYRIVKGMSCRFRYPAAVSALSFLLFASQNAPPIYAMYYIGDPKLRNIIYFSYIWLLFGNAMYWMGWISRCFTFGARSPGPRPLKAYAGFLYFCLAAALFVTGIGLNISQGNRRVDFDPDRASATALTLRDLSAGLPRRFLEEHDIRQGILEDDSQPDVWIAAYSDLPLTLVPFLPYHRGSGHVTAELTHYHAHWVNRSMAEYYGKNRVIGLPAEKTVATSRAVAIEYEGDRAELQTYVISDMRYFRIRDLAFILRDVFDVSYSDGQYVLDTGRGYAPAGNELMLSPPGVRDLPARLSSGDVIVNGAAVGIPSYMIRDEVFHRSDILYHLGISDEESGGVIRLEKHPY